MILLGVLIAVYGLGRLRSNGPNLYRAVNHEITGLDNSTSSLRYVVFTDPQFGLADIVEKRGEGLDWEQDKKHMASFARHVNELKPDFVFCTGDLRFEFVKNLIKTMILATPIPSRQNGITF